jgi:hypothetical protein
MTSEAIELFAALALAHYEHHAHEFWQGTRDHEVSQAIAARCATSTHPRNLACQGLGAVKLAISRPPGKSATTPPVLREPRDSPRWRVPGNYLASAGLTELTCGYSPAGLPFEQWSRLVSRSTSQRLERRGTAPTQAQSRGLERQDQDHAEQPASFDLLPSWSTWLAQLLGHGPMYC